MTAERSLAPVDLSPIDYSILEQVLIKGDLSKLTPQERSTYYMRVCESTGLNALTKPFEYITLNGKLVLYALKGGTDQLRSLRGINIVDTKTEYVEELIVVTVTGEDRFGRRDSEIGAVTIGGLKGDAKANALMKALTKAKRRLTLSMCGLGMLDESEVETIPSARPYTEPVASPAVTYLPHSEILDHETGEIIEQPAPVDDEAAKQRQQTALSSVFKIGTDKGLERDDVKAIAYHKYTVDSMTKLTIENLRDYYRFLNQSDEFGLQFELSQARAAMADDATFEEVEG